jgi:chromosome segregation ATPase
MEDEKKFYDYSSPYDIKLAAQKEINKLERALEEKQRWTENKDRLIDTLCRENKKLREESITNNTIIKDKNKEIARLYSERDTAELRKSELLLWKNKASELMERSNKRISELEKEIQWELQWKKDVFEPELQEKQNKIKHLEEIVELQGSALNKKDEMIQDLNLKLIRLRAAVMDLHNGVEAKGSHIYNVYASLDSAVLDMKRKMKEALKDAANKPAEG